MIHKKVRFKGEEYWFHDSGRGAGAMLSPLDHYNEEGELLAHPFHDVSYGIILNGNVMRYGEVIGKEEELEEIWSLIIEAQKI